MRIKVKIFKRIISLLCVMSMATLSMINSVGAVDAMEGAEAAFSMAYMNCLPKKGKADFNKFSGKFERGKAKDKFGKTFYGNLQKQRLYEKVKCSDDFGRFYDKDITIKEKEVYVKIKKKVKELKEKVDKRTPNKEMTQEEIEEGIKNRTISKHWKMPKRWRIAKAIYRWVAREIKYDYDSIKKDENGQDSFRKPQDPLFVFDQKTGVCVGKANLVNLMMRMARIPSAVIVSDTHAFNAIYLKNKKNKPGRNGWTLIDATWGASESDMEIQTGPEEKIETMKKMLRIPIQEVMKNDLGQLYDGFVDRINRINRLVDPDKLKDSEGYGKEFSVFWEHLYKKYACELKYCVGVLRDYYKEHNSLEAVKARNRVNEIVGNMNIEIRTKLSELYLKYKDVVGFESFEIRFIEIGSCLPGVLGLLFADMKVNLPVKDFKKVEEKINYLSDKRKMFFPGFYDKILSFKDVNEDIIDKRAHKIREIVFEDWYDLHEHEKNSVFNLIIDGVTYKRLIDKEGAFRGIKLIGDENRSLENVKISPDMANFGIQFEIGCGIRSLTLKGNEIIDWSSVGSLESVDITESNRYMVENGVLYWKKDGSKGDKVNVPKQIQFVNQKENKEREKEEREKREKEEREEKERLEREKRERIKKLKQIIKDINTKIEKEQNELRYQNSRNAQNRFMQLACLKSDIENIENELKNENFKDNNKLVEYENQINKLANECGFETV